MDGEGSGRAGGQQQVWVFVKVCLRREQGVLLGTQRLKACFWRGGQGWHREGSRWLAAAVVVT